MKIIWHPASRDFAHASSRIRAWPPLHWLAANTEHVYTTATVVTCLGKDVLVAELAAANTTKIKSEKSAEE